MIKKITGILFAAAAVAVIVTTVMHRGEYRSLFFEPSDETIARTETAAAPDATPADTTPADAAEQAAQQTDAQQTPADTTATISPDQIRQ